MLINEMTLWLIFFCTSTFSKEVVTHNTIKFPEQLRIVTTKFLDDSDNKGYTDFNLFTYHDNMTVEEEVHYRGKKVYSVTYNTIHYGFRKTKTNENAKEHLILGGDSNMFGMGVEDNETLPSLVALKNPDKKIVNLGLVGQGPNAHLFFLQNYSLEPLIGKTKKGIMIYDFHYHLIERVIGSKQYVVITRKSPRYVLKNDRVIFAGKFDEAFSTKFYLLLSKLPWSDKLFPNLPQINHDHLVLVAKIFAEMKKVYLNQTDSSNRFIVSFNPAYFTDSQMTHIKDLQALLRDEQIEFITFNRNEIKPLPVIDGDSHQTSMAHFNYSIMLMERLNRFLVH